MLPWQTVKQVDNPSLHIRSALLHTGSKDHPTGTLSNGYDHGTAVQSLRRESHLFQTG